MYLLSFRTKYILVKALKILISKDQVCQLLINKLCFVSWIFTYVRNFAKRLYDTCECDTYRN